jgi:poly-gamma-glutamate synthesis protein (capsule biosynthesis protein)
MVSQKKLILLSAITTFSVIIITGLYFYFKFPNSSPLYISGAVVPHHNLMAPQRADFFSELSKHIIPPRTIVLLSPNHYSAGYGNIQTTSKDWELGEGQVNSDYDVVSFLVKNNFATDEPSSFIYEHGIYNILTDIYNDFPNAKIVPIILKNVSQVELDKLEQGLKESCFDCLMIASVDFSHYMPTPVPQTHDEKSIKELQTLNINAIFLDPDVDSGSALALLVTWAKDHNTNYFNLQDHTDSGSNTKNLSVEATTHVFGWYQ